MMTHERSKQGVFNNRRAKRGASVVEYIVLTMMITGALYVMKDSISRGIFAKFKSAGDSYAYGRQYDAKRSSVCKTDLTNRGAEVSYDEDCYTKLVMRDPDHGGCPQCYPGEEDCFRCEDAIKSQCACKN